MVRANGAPLPTLRIHPHAALSSRRAVFPGGIIMRVLNVLASTGIVMALAVSSVAAQQPQTQRLRGTIERVEGSILFVKGRDGTPMTLKLADNIVVTAVYKASARDIKEGYYIGSGAMPQADGSQKALEVHI